MAVVRRGNAFSALMAQLEAGKTPDASVSQAALVECLGGAPPQDNRLASIVGFITHAGESVDWIVFDRAVKIWRESGQINARIARRICDAALAGARQIDDILAIMGSFREVSRTHAEGQYFGEQGPFAYSSRSDIEDVLREPATTLAAAHPHDKALYIADLAQEVTGEDTSEIVDPLAQVFALPPQAQARDALALLGRIEVPMPGFPYLGMNSSNDYFNFLALAYGKCAVALRAGTPPVPVIALPKSGSAFLTSALASTLDIPVGAASHRHVFGVPSWISFAARFPIALHDHLPPSTRAVELLRSNGCERLVLHIRDPRQFVISFAHHVVKGDFFESESLRPAFRSQGWSGLIDAIAERVSPRIGAWLGAWLEQSRKSGIELLVTRYEDMAAGPVAVAQSVLDFLAPSVALIRPLSSAVSDLRAQQTSGGLNFRAGRADEWREVLSNKQIAMIADQTRSSFGLFYSDLA